MQLRYVLLLHLKYFGRLMLRFRTRLRPVGIERLEYVNQEYHTFRHVGEAGIDKKAAEDAIRADLAPKADSMPEGFTSGEVRVAGKTLRYNAFKLPDGTINVGRITVH